MSIATVEGLIASALSEMRAALQDDDPALNPNIKRAATLLRESLDRLARTSEGIRNTADRLENLS